MSEPAAVDGEYWRFELYLYAFADNRRIKRRDDMIYLCKKYVSMHKVKEARR